MSDMGQDGEKMQGDRGDAKAEPSGPKGDNPGTAGSGEIAVKQPAAQDERGRLNPSAPGETGTTPGTNGK